MCEILPRGASQQPLCQLRGIALAHVVQVHHPRILIDQMVVDRHDLEPASLQLFDCRSHFGLKQHQIAHHPALFLERRECGPGTQREARRDRCTADVTLRSVRGHEYLYTEAGSCCAFFPKMVSIWPGTTAPPAADASAEAHATINALKIDLCICLFSKTSGVSSPAPAISLAVRVKRVIHCKLPAHIVEVVGANSPEPFCDRLKAGSLRRPILLWRVR
jgi:hypothetical protein